MMRYGLGGFGGVGMLVGGLFAACIALVVITLVVLAIVALVKHTGSSSKNVSPAIQGSVNNNLAILDERYAKGEIDDEEYARRKENLKKG